MDSSSESSSESDYSDSSESSSELSSLENKEKYEDCSKRSETFHIISNDGNDRISELPDLVLRHILSFIDMKEVIGNTSRISRRWRDLWISLPFLNFNHSLWNYKNKFISFVDKVLLCRDDSIIKKLCFCISRRYDNYGEIDRFNDWMTLAARKHVEEVHLYLDFGKSEVLPQLIFKSDIQVFKLRTSFRTKMRLPNSVCLATKLKILEIYGVELPKCGSNEELLLSCLSLEILLVHFCNHKHIRTLLISAPQLKKLVLENRASCNNGSCKLQISTRNLKSLVLKGSLYEDYSLENLSSLECAKFESPVLVDAGLLIKVLQGLHNATTLELSGESKMTSVESLNILDQPIHPFVNLRFLKISGWSCSSCIPTIHNLLTNSYRLETLTLGISQVGEVESWGELFLCICRLKSIEIKGLKGSADELKFFEFILKNAVVLEYLTLYIHEYFSLTKKDLAEFNMKIHSLPRASSSVKILPFFLT